MWFTLNKNCRGSFYNPTIIGLSNTVEFENPFEPLQGHIALTANANEIL